MGRIVAEQHQIPGSLRTRVAHSTLREWLRLYRAGGFDALKLPKRIDSGNPRALPADLADQLLNFKESDPDLSTRLIIEKAREKELIASDADLPVSTVHRLFKSHDVMSLRSQENGGTSRFAFQDAGQLCMSDVMHVTPGIWRERDAQIGSKVCLEC